MRKLICFGLLLVVIATSLPAEVQITKCKFLAPYFKEPFEYFIFVFNDDSAYLFTSGDERQIDMGAAGLAAIFKTLGHSIPDIVLIIHNHVVPQSWSVGHGDRGFVGDLRKLGFKGAALLYLPGGKIIPADF